VAVLAAGVAEAALVHLGRTYGSTAAEQAMRIPGDDIIAEPVVVTNHAISAPSRRSESSSGGIRSSRSGRP
jgi:hypothetical protein